MAEQEFELSLNPDTFVEGGGLIDDFDGTVKSWKYVMFQYPNSPLVVPSLELIITDEDNVDHTQNWSCGDSKNFAVSPDGKRLVLVGNAKGISKDSNVAMLMESLRNAGFDMASFKGLDCSPLVGAKFHWLRKAVAKRKPTDKDRSVLCVTDIINLPGEKGAKKTSAKASSSASVATTPSSADPESENQASQLVLEILSTDGAINKKILLGKVTKIAAERRMPVKKIVPLINDEFLGSDTAAWEYDQETGTVKPYGMA